jgi:DNA-directed RNA polymerase specialized sigma24 family protein
VKTRSPSLSSLRQFSPRSLSPRTLDRLFKNYLGTTFGFRGADLEDVTQDAWVRMLETGAIEKAEHFGYLKRLMRNMVYDQFRAKACIKRVPR